MDSTYKQLCEVSVWLVNDEKVKKEVKKIIKDAKNPKLAEDQYLKNKGLLEKFPPSSPPYTLPKAHPTEPWLFWVYTEGHIRLKIQAYYQLWSKTCYITKVSLV